jgi:xanthine dehydrogenase small subunit
MAATTTKSLDLKCQGQRYSAPASLEELQTLYAENPSAQILSGATDIGLWVTKQHRQLPHLIHIGNVAELDSLKKTDGHITIGAGVTHQQAMEALAEDYPALQEIWSRFGSAQVRASARVCGNIANASPIGDLSPCFLALDSQIVLNKAGKRRQIKLDSFFIDYGKQNREAGEFVEAIILPRLQAGQQLLAYKLSKRFDQDISAVLMAGCIDVQAGKITDIKIGFGGMAAIPKRAMQLEAYLKGREVSVFAGEMEAKLATDIATCLSQDFDPIDDMRASRSYRLLAAAQLVQKMFIEYQSGYMRLSKPQHFRTPEDFTATVQA